jgi:CRISPR/Cas system-associated endonuclease Cas1
MLDIAHVAAFGNADISSAAIRACFEAGIPVLWLTSGGWLVGTAAQRARQAYGSGCASIAQRWSATRDCASGS